MSGRFRVVVGGRSSQTFGWTIPDTPYTLAVSNEGVEAPYSLSNYIVYGPDVTPVWQLISAPAGVTLGATGILVKDTTVPQSIGYEIVVSISRNFAGTEEYRRRFLLPVNPAITTPEWSASTPTTITMVRNGTFNFGPYATDPVGSTLTYSLQSPTPSKYSINPSTGVVTLGNSAPEFTVYQTEVSLPYSTSTQTIQFTAVDSDGDTITYSLPQTRTGITISPTTGLVSVASTAAGTTGDITVRAYDGITTADVICSVTVASNVVAGTLIKWNPGVYPYLSPSDGHKDGATQRANDLTKIQSYAANPNITGITIQKYIRALERNVATPTYDWTEQVSGVNYGGFAMVDHYLALCEQYDLRLYLEFEQIGVGTTPIPSYWDTQGWRYNTTDTSRVWLENSGALNRLIALVQAYGARYNGHPRLEMVGFEETTTTVSNAAAYRAAWKTLLSAAVAAFPNTMVRCTANWITGGGSGMLDLLQHIETLNYAGTGCVITGGPDHEYGTSPPGSVANPTNQIDAHRMWRGEAQDSVTYKDVRGVMPWVAETQTRGAGNINYPVSTPTDLWAYWKNTMKASHFIMTTYMTPGGSFTADCITWAMYETVINANGGQMNPTPPTCLTGRTVTGSGVVNLGTVSAGTDWEEFASGFEFTSVSTTYPLEYGSAVQRNSNSITTIDGQQVRMYPTIVSAPAYNGSRACKFPMPAISVPMPDPNGSFRSELKFAQSFAEVGGPFVEGVEHFIGFAIYLNPNFPTGTQNVSTSVIQSWATNNLNYYDRNPKMCVRILQTGNWGFTCEWEGSGSWVYDSGVSIAADRGRWVRLVWHIKYSATNSGFLRLYRDGVKLTMTQTAGTSRPAESCKTWDGGSSTMNTYPFGNYSANRKYYADGDRTLYIDSLRIASAAYGGTLAGVDPVNY